VKTAVQLSWRGVGREAELSALHAFLDGDRGPHAFVVVGDPGIGKTTLWEAGVVAARERGFRVLVARPNESEAKMAFAALSDLLDGVDATALRAVPRPQRRALEVALLRAEPGDSRVEPFAISAGLTGLLRSLAEAELVLVAIDDVPWLDETSAEALTFAARRAETVRFLLTRRSGDATSLEHVLESAGVERMEVQALSLGATRVLLSRRLGLSLPRHALRRVFELTGGNPLFALELGRMLGERGVPVVGAELPLPPVVDDLFGARIDKLPRPLRRLLLACSLSGDLHQAQLATIEGSSAIEEACEAGLLAADGDRFRPSHPLLAAAARGSSTASERRQLHLLLARAVVDEELRVRHLALATLGPDGALAQTAADAAASAAARGARPDAVELAGHALRLTPDGADERPDRVLALAGFLHAYGDDERLAAVLNAELESLPAGVRRAQAFLFLSESADAETLDELEHRLDRALAECPDDPAIRSQVLAKKSAYTIAIRVERVQEAEEWALDALEAAAGAGPDAERLALEALAWARGYRGRPLDDISRRFESSSDPAPYLADSPERPAVLRHVWRGEIDAARADLVRMRSLVADHDEQVSFTLLSFDLAHLELRVGNLDRTAQLLEELAGPDALRSPAYEFSRALLAAGRGHPDEVESWATRTIERARQVGVRLDELEALRARGLAALLRGDSVLAAESLRLIWEHTQREGVDDPGVFPVAADLVEALVELGELDMARAVTERLQRLSEEQQHPWGLASVRRCRGLIELARGYNDAAVAQLLEAAEAYGALGLRFDQARSLLVLGRAQRRSRKWAAARASLGRADALFEELGSPGWSHHARSELARVGARRPAAEGELTRAEERVALLAAEGRSNKEIAAELFVSVKTVEKHLSRAYAKLGVHSRGRLAQRLRTS
jgi:DNA-binding CsgD family transcriptional regulator